MVVFETVDVAIYYLQAFLSIFCFKFSELDMFADDEDIAIAEAAAAASKSSVKDDSNHQLMRANENPNLTDNWDDAEG